MGPVGLGSPQGSGGRGGEDQRQRRSVRGGRKERGEEGADKWDRHVSGGGAAWTRPAGLELALGRAEAVWAGKPGWHWAKGKEKERGSGPAGWAAGLVSGFGFLFSFSIYFPISNLFKTI